jgi:hypothetical protein
MTRIQLKQFSQPTQQGPPLGPKGPSRALRRQQNLAHRPRTISVPPQHHAMSASVSAHYAMFSSAEHASLPSCNHSLLALMNNVRHMQPNALTMHRLFYRSNAAQCFWPFTIYCLPCTSISLPALRATSLLAPCVTVARDCHAFNGYQTHGPMMRFKVTCQCT